MRVKNIGSNMTEIESKVGVILVSYSTPVAVCMADGSGFFRTERKWSQTTSKHINRWLDGAKATERPQEFFDGLL